ncbi:MAG: putative toxin-antitoxin system toxin component, PIN family [bacterium]
MKIVIDTNVIVKAACGKGQARKLLDAWLEGEFQLLISNTMLLEYEEVLTRPKFNFPKWAIASFFYPFISKANQIHPTRLHALVIEDPDDNKFIDCAIEGKANFIVSEDPHLLKLKQVEGIRIVTTNKFLKLLK